MKRCSKCKTEYPSTTEYFVKNKNSKDGLFSWCKTCKNNLDIESYHKYIEENLRKRKEWRKNNKEIKSAQDKKHREKMKNRDPNTIFIPKQKICAFCKKTKDYDKFYNDKNKKDGLNEYCKRCTKILNSKSYQKHKEKRKEYNNGYELLNKEKIATAHKIYYQKHKRRIKRYKRLWQEKNHDKISNKQKRYRMLNRKQLNKKNVDRKKNDINYKILCNLRTELSQVLNAQHARKSNHTMELVECSIDKLKKHLKSKFKEGMNFDNYGKGDDKWSIDHIRPCSSFDLTNPQQQRKCFNYLNLQPMWNKENLKKNSLYNGKFIRNKRVKNNKKGDANGLHFSVSTGP